VIAQSKPQGFDVVTADIDLQRLHRIRTEMPVLVQRRDSL